MSQPLLKLLASHDLLYCDHPFEAGTTVRGPEHCLPDRRLMLEYFEPGFLPRTNLAWMFEKDGVLKNTRVLRNDLSLDETLERGNLFVFIGATNSTAFKKALAKDGARILVFDPDIQATGKLLFESNPEAFIKKRIQFFVGDPQKFSTPLGFILSPDVFDSGYPMFYVSQDLAEAGEYVEPLAQQLEFLFYRHQLYDISGQKEERNYPDRDIVKKLFYDQQLHLMENIPQFVRCAGVEDVKDLFRDKSAILIGASPDLKNKLDYIKANWDKAVLICVNSALPVLVNHGIKPHFVVINDHSTTSAKSLQNLDKCPQTILVSHTLSGSGKYNHPRTLWFDEPPLAGLPTHEDLPLYGSVISTAYSLARLLGCKEAIFVGAQLSSHNPWGLDYSEGSLQAGHASQTRELTWRYPQLYPVETFGGHTVFTTLNFRDAALWLIDLIHTGDIDTINTSPDSILYSDRIRLDPEPPIRYPVDAGNLLRRCEFTPPPADIKTLLEYIDAQMRKWRSIAESTEDLKRHPLESPGLLEQFTHVLKVFDDSNVSYLLQRFDDFSYMDFCWDFLVETDETTRLEAGRTLVTAANAMAKVFIRTLAKTLEQLNDSFSAP